jgi:hypothetical protein
MRITPLIHLLPHGDGPPFLDLMYSQSEIQAFRSLYRALIEVRRLHHKFLDRFERWIPMRYSAGACGWVWCSPCIGPGTGSWI